VPSGLEPVIPWSKFLKSLVAAQATNVSRTVMKLEGSLNGCAMPLRWDRRIKYALAYLHIEFLVTSNLILSTKLGLGIPNGLLHFSFRTEILCYASLILSMHATQPFYTTCHLFTLTILGADPLGRAVYGEGLQPLACWECEFESRRRRGCVSYECCVLSGRGLCVRLIIRPQQSYWVWCGECDNEASMRKPWPTRGWCAMENKIWQRK
jgi:hypothetical protein